MNGPTVTMQPRIEFPCGAFSVAVVCSLVWVAPLVVVTVTPGADGSVTVCAVAKPTAPAIVIAAVILSKWFFIVPILQIDHDEPGTN